jgi:hypothetical protein
VIIKISFSSVLTYIGVEFGPNYKKKKYITPIEESRKLAQENIRKKSAMSAASAQLFLKQEDFGYNSYQYNSYQYNSYQYNSYQYNSYQYNS